MPIRTIVDRAIESAEHGNGGILLNGTDGSSSNENSFLVLDASKSATIDVNEKIEFEQETIAEENIESTVKSLNFDAIKLENEDGTIDITTGEKDGHASETIKGFDILIGAKGQVFVGNIGCC